MRRISKKLSTLSLALLFAASFSACSPSASPDASESSTPSQTAAEETASEETAAAPKTSDPVPVTETEEAPQILSFSTTDLEGNEVSIEDFQEAKVILVNFWEPWCGPCVSEMPDLSALYDQYQEQGLVILGVFGDSEEDAKGIISQYGISYPILHTTEDFAPFTTAYVPTTILTDGSGTLLSSEPLIGARSYEDWEAIIREYLDEA